MALPVGKSVRNEPAVPFTTVRLIDAAVASAGTLPASDNVTTPPALSVWIVLAASRVSRTRTGTTGTSEDASPGFPRADAAKSPPPPSEMAIAAPAAAQRERQASTFMIKSPSEAPSRAVLRWRVGIALRNLRNSEFSASELGRITYCRRHNAHKTATPGAQLPVTILSAALVDSRHPIAADRVGAEPVESER